jgi:GntR family transcriptional regulator
VTSSGTEELEANREPTVDRGSRAASASAARGGKGERLREFLTEAIRGLEPGSALPTERDLCERFGVSRGTVRHVLQQLENQQRIYRRQGRGTFVATAKIEQRLNLTSHTESMLASGIKPSSRLIEVSRIEAPAEIAAALALPAAAEVLRIERVRLADDEPIALEVLYVSAERFDGISGALQLGESFYGLLHSQYGIELAHADETIEAVIADERGARLLGCAPGSALLQLSRLTVDQRGRPVEYVRSLYRGDRFRLRQTVQRPGVTGAAGPDQAGAGPRLRPAVPADAEALAEVFVTTWQRNYRSVVPDDVIDALDLNETAQWLKGLLTTAEQSTILVEAPDGKVLGFVRFGAESSDPRNGHIHALYVHADHGGQGLGRKLLRSGLAGLKRSGYDVITLWVFKKNAAARGLYASEGFEPDGGRRVEEQFRADEIHMRREPSQTSHADGNAAEVGGA